MNRLAHEDRQTAEHTESRWEDDLLDAATRLVAAFDELQSTTTAERIITGRSDAALRRESNEAIADLRAAIAKATGAA